MCKNGLFHSHVSQTRQASDGGVLSWHVMKRALRSWNLCSFCINITCKFVLVFESQTLGYKLNPVSCEKISQTFVSNTEKIAQLIDEEIR